MLLLPQTRKKTTLKRKVYSQNLIESDAGRGGTDEDEGDIEASEDTGVSKEGSKLSYVEGNDGNGHPGNL